MKNHNWRLKVSNSGYSNGYPCTYRSYTCVYRMRRRPSGQGAWERCLSRVEGIIRSTVKDLAKQRAGCGFRADRAHTIPTDLLR